jgi:hypothetical protein
MKEKSCDLHYDQFGSHRVPKTDLVIFKDDVTIYTTIRRRRTLEELGTA